MKKKRKVNVNTMNVYTYKKQQSQLSISMNTSLLNSRCTAVFKRLLLTLKSLTRIESQGHKVKTVRSTLLLNTTAKTFKG